jgi:hypothetical protein
MRTRHVLVGLGIALMLVATAAWGQDQRPAADVFRVSLQPETDPVASRMEGRIHNDSGFRVTNVRLHVEGVDASGQPVGRRFTWAFGDIAPGGETSFILEAMPGAVSYRIAVDAFDVVSAPGRPSPAGADVDAPLSGGTGHR